MTKLEAKDLLMDFLVRKLHNKEFMAEALVNDYLNNDTDVVNLLLPILC